VQARAQRITTANHAALIFSLEPFFAALFAFWILGQVMTVREWIGGTLVLAGILVSELQISKRAANGESCAPQEPTSQ
jgi:drug/metabolite transporter (DMT)-like permease